MTEPRRHVAARPARGLGKGRLHRRPKRWRISLAMVLSLVIGALVAVGIGVVLAVWLWGAFTNTASLLGDKTHLILDTVRQELSAQLDPGAEQAAYLAERFADPRIDLTDNDAIAEALGWALAATPQVDGVVFIRFEGNSVGVRNGPDGEREVGIFPMTRPDPQEALAYLRQLDSPYAWGTPNWSDGLDGTVVNLVRVVGSLEEPLGLIGVAVRVGQISAFLDTITQSTHGTAFVLYGPDKVLAHPLFAVGDVDVTPEEPLPDLAGFADPVLGRIWWEEGREEIDYIDFRPGTAAHILTAFDTAYVYVYEEVAGYADRPIILGVYYDDRDIGLEIRRLLIIIGVSFAVFAIAIVAAILIARRLARPIRRAADASLQVGRMEFGALTELPRSHVRELDDQAAAFNNMINALGWFEIYVPRRLVGRLMARGDRALMQSHDIEVTVMFTDIAGFTRWSEGRDAQDVAGFLNTHFATLAECIEAEAGTLDKFIGDGLMAFWGAPDPQHDHAERACRAALAIADAMDAFNARNRDAGAPPLHLRIGLHSGRATVGNIGAPQRMNYTVVGDTVNVCQRLEAMAKSVQNGDGSTTVVISAETATRLSPGADLTAIGETKLDGRDAPVAVCQLHGLAPVADDGQTPN